MSNAEKTEYPFGEIEKKWQKFWVEQKLFRADPAGKKPKFYCLVMFPYPSAALHMGHCRVYILGDVVARYKMMRGFNVLTPMGFDAFGLPAENAAIKGKEHPADLTHRNIATMRRQYHSLGVEYDWDREVISCEPDYYKWTQWLFLKLFEKGLAFKKLSAVNWCPSCQTVLANEQVIDGLCERCDTAVEQRELEQWFFKITAYAQRLLDDMKLLDNWPERVKTMQVNWIGRSEGVEIDFKVVGEAAEIPCFTTRIDTIYGCTYMVLAAEHPLVFRLIKGTAQEKAVREFVSKVLRENKFRRVAEDVEKEGVFTGKYVLNPFTGEKVPVWVANYVLMEYGTGAVMAVPAHDQRDFLFAKKYGLPIRVVIQPGGKTLEPATMKEAYVEDGVMVHSAPFDGNSNRDAMEKITGYGEKKKYCRRAVNYRLRDWLISRQRYWGAPIPIIYCAKCGMVPVPEMELPVLLPRQVEFRPTGESPLARHPEFVNTPCPRCKAPARRETDTMDTFVDSSWYFLRYISAQDKAAAFVTKDVNRWLPVDQYIGGVEHAILHLMYSRFFTKVLFDLGLINFPEPFRNLFTQGMIIKDGAKMSKSRGNVVSPDDLIEKYGADTVRCYTLFIGPPEKDAEWNDASVEGAYRFLKRVWRLVNDYLSWKGSEKGKEAAGPLSSEAREIRRWTHVTIKRVTDDIELDWHFNTAIAAIMEFVNYLASALDKMKGESSEGRLILDEAMETLAIMLAPFVPHLSEEIWQRLGKTGSIFQHPWPAHKEEWLKTEEVEVVLQVNGKLRGRLQVPTEINKAELEKLALAQPVIQEWTKGKKVRSVVVVPKKLVNVVTEG